MVPEPSLPYPSLAALAMGIAIFSLISIQRTTALAHASFNNSPPRGKIVVIFRQRPDGVKMIRQQHPGLNGEGQSFPDLLNPLPQGCPDLVVCQKWLAAKCDHGKEIGASP